jgi:murein L,D-transpeptidase YcbB/YkuD
MHIMNKLYPVTFFAALVFIFLGGDGCRSSRNQGVSAAGAPAIDQPNPAAIVMPEDPADSAYWDLSRKNAVIAFYHQRGYAPVWSDNPLHMGVSDSMVWIIRNARYAGLHAAYYRFQEIIQRRAVPAPENRIRTDALLTDAFLSMASDLKYGRRTPSPVNDSLLVSLLQRALVQRALAGTLKGQEPRCPGYGALKDALRTLLDTAQAATAGEKYAGEVKYAPATEATARTLAVNLERWRTTCTYPEASRRIRINIPSFLLEVIDHDTVVLESRVIVGAVKTPTPELSSRVDCIIFYPYWYVPRKIAVEEFLPAIKKDTSFIGRNNFDVLDRKGKILSTDSIPWGKFSKNYFPVVLRQREGSENSLGIIKFNFDNPYAVFLHDTNAKGLFKSKTRAFSHGCIRMERSVELAKYLIVSEGKDGDDEVDRVIEQHQRRSISLASSIPIQVCYFTCEVKNGRLLQYSDLYRRDRELESLLYASLFAELTLK